MATDYLPSTDEGLRAWAENYSDLITAGPVPLGLSTTIATQLASYFTAYSDALAAATAAPTRGGSTVEAKNIARKNLTDYIRQTARQVQGTMTVTDQQRYDLGLTVRDGSATPINPPTEAPMAEIKQIVGRIATVRLHGISTEGRGKPSGCSAAWVFTYVGTTPPADLSAWKFFGASTRTEFEVEFPATVEAGAQFWVCAQWISPRNQPGPASAPITDYLGGGVAMAA